MISKKQVPEEEFSEAETEQRFLAALKGALNTSPKPLKEMPKTETAAKKKRATTR